MAKGTGFDDLDKIGRRMSAAALVAGIAGVAGGLEDQKNDLKAAAPVGKGKIGTRGHATKGGRTKSSIGYAYPRVVVIAHNEFGAAADVEVTAVMAPQGIYHNDGVAPQRISPKQKQAMVWYKPGQNIWFAVGPRLKSGFGTDRNPGYSRAGMGTQFVQGGAVTKGAQPGSKWIDKVADKFFPSIVASEISFGRIMNKKHQRATGADVPKRAFEYNAPSGAWGSGYSASNDQRLRNNWRSAANRAGSVWANQVRAAIAKLRF